MIEFDMRVPIIYLETTIFNFPFADDAPQYQADTLQLFKEIKAGKFKPFAAVTVAGLDFIVSLNFRHIVKRKTIIETEIINAREGFRRVFIHTPAEVINYEEEL